MGSLLLGGRGRLTSAAHRRKAIELIGEAHAAGAGLVSACGEMGICLRTLKRWRKVLIGDGGGHDRRKGSPRRVLHRLSEEERQRILLICNQAEYGDVAEREDPTIAADLVSRACLKERISKRRKQPLVLHADNGNA